MAMVDEKVTAELVRSLYAELQAKDAELARRDVQIHETERKLRAAVGQVRLMQQDRDFQAV